MGYRSQVRSLIYGEPDTICQLVAAHALQGGHNVFTAFGDDITRYRTTRQRYDHDATVAAGPDPDNGRPQVVWQTVEVEVIDLYGDDWKWCEDYEDVKAWTAFMDQAEELGLSVEFVRIGEENDDVESRFTVQDEESAFLSVSRTIEVDMPDTRPVDYDEVKAA